MLYSPLKIDCNVVTAYETNLCLKAEERIRALVEGKAMPPLISQDSSEEVAEEELNAPLYLEGYASDQIRSYIGRKFRGHELTRLVTEMLKAQGYKVLMSPVGPDGGVDIIAGRGTIGFDQPRLCVQVKSSDSPVDVTVLRELKGVMDDFKAEQGFIGIVGRFQTVCSERVTEAFLRDTLMGRW